MTHINTFSTNRSASKKRLKQATPRKVVKTKQPNIDVADQGVAGDVTTLFISIINKIIISILKEKFLVDTICKSFIQLFLVGVIIIRLCHNNNDYYYYYYLYSNR